jgi:hypothetical protein
VEDLRRGTASITRGTKVFARTDQVLIEVSYRFYGIKRLVSSVLSRSAEEEQLRQEYEPKNWHRPSNTFGWFWRSSRRRRLDPTLFIRRPGLLSRGSSYLCGDVHAGPGHTLSGIALGLSRSRRTGSRLVLFPSLSDPRVVSSRRTAASSQVV